MIEHEDILIEGASKGSQSDFAKLYDAYIEQIYRFAYFKLSNKKDAEDLAHDVFLTAWQNMPNFISMGHPFSSWLYKITKNKIIDRWRGKKNNISTETMKENGQEIEFSSNLVEKLNTDMTSEVAISAVKKLDHIKQEVMFLKYVSEMDTKEIAKVIGKTEGATRVILHRAIQEVKTNLNEQYGGNLV